MERYETKYGDVENLKEEKRFHLLNIQQERECAGSVFGGQEARENSHATDSSVSTNRRLDGRDRAQVDPQPVVFLSQKRK
jgi:hypothetical protein